MSPQYFIALFGLSAVYMSMVSESATARRWAPVVGLCGQPFWLYSTGTAHQWGMFALCCAYTVIYVKGSFGPREQRVQAQGRSTMAIDRTYRCNLCRDTLSLAPLIGKQAHGIHWESWPTKGWISKAAGQVENHLCAPCISSIQAMPAMCGQGFDCNGGPKCGSDHA